MPHEVFTSASLQVNKKKIDLLNCVKPTIGHSSEKIKYLVGKCILLWLYGEYNMFFFSSSNASVFSLLKCIIPVGSTTKYYILSITPMNI
jgi:hypothetical protein